jgi:hypothetical protein
MKHRLKPMLWFLTFFTEAASPPAETDSMKIWLLRHKQ